MWFFKAPSDSKIAIIVGMIGYNDADRVYLSVVTQKPYKAMDDLWFNWYTGFGTSGDDYPHS